MTSSNLRKIGFGTGGAAALIALTVAFAPINAFGAAHPSDGPAVESTAVPRECATAVPVKLHGNNCLDRDQFHGHRHGGPSDDRGKGDDKGTSQSTSNGNDASSNNGNHNGAGRSNGNHNGAGR